MRIAIDMQGAQTESRFRGIGRYTMSLAQAIVRNRGDHEIILALNGLFPDTIEPIRAAFVDLLPQESIRVWYAPGPVRECEPGNDWRRQVAELIREAFFASLQPDVIHISSIFEGYLDDATTSIGRFDRTTPVTASLYDLIPLLNPTDYLTPDPLYAQYYLRKIEHLKHATACLAISRFTRQEGLANLGMSERAVVNVSTAIESRFRPIHIEEQVRSHLRDKFNLPRPFVLHTGGADERKNLPRLIAAFSALPARLRASHQLLLAGKIPATRIAELTHYAASLGLDASALRFTDYVTDEELVQLYTLCKLFVFPSWHEGFGLPALEAMACGAPTIGANTSSLPDVIGLDSALFDPLDVNALAATMTRALEDDTFRTRLREHGLQQAKRFSWDDSATRAIATFESLHGHHETSRSYPPSSLSDDGLIQALAQHIPASDVPTLPTIAAHVAHNLAMGIQRQLMLDVSEISQRDAATGVQRVVRSYLRTLLLYPPAGFRAEPVYATRQEGYRYARRFTHGFLGHGATSLIDEPVHWQRGDVFFGLDMQHHVQLAHQGFYRQLRREGVTVKFLVHDLLPIQMPGFFKDPDAKALHERWLETIAATDGAICVSKATADAYDTWLSENAIHTSPNFRTAWVHSGADIDGSNPSHGLPADGAHVLEKIQSRLSFLCVATLEPRKGQQQILDAFQLLWNEGKDVNLVLVGQRGWNVGSLAESIHTHRENNHRLFWLKGISDEYLGQVYAASTCLIAASVNEGFGLPLIEAARHAIPIIARDIPVFREVAGECAFYFTGDTPRDLATALTAWLHLHRDARHPQSTKLRWATWRESTERLKDALLHHNHPHRQLLVDISELVQRDARSGIQRVVRSILKEWLTNPPIGYRVEPVYATVDRGYRYARRFTDCFLGGTADLLQDEPIEYTPGDNFVALDLQPQVVRAHREVYQALRRDGVRVTFVVYDLLSVLLPQHFPPGAAEAFDLWLHVVAESDGAICISKTVADELTDWLRTQGQDHRRPFTIDWFHLGVDVDHPAPTNGLPTDADHVRDHLRSRMSFLMVGTLEPRKGHAQVLDAFNQLWQTGYDLNLVLVGKQGWQVDHLAATLRTHPEFGKRLFWLEGVTDARLESLYGASTCLIAAAYGEGFGLPLTEAARHKLPIIARDIPVFQEVAGEHAYYFSSTTSAELAHEIGRWLTLYAANMIPRPDGLRVLTWKQAADTLFRKCRSAHGVLREIAR